MISRFNTCMEHRTESNHVELTARLLHLRDPIFGAIRVTALCTSIDQAIVGPLIWNDTMFLHLHQPMLGLLQATTSGTRIDKGVVDPCVCWHARLHHVLEPSLRF